MMETVHRILFPYLVLLFVWHNAVAEHIHLENLKVAHHIDSRYVGVNFDSGLFRTKWHRLDTKNKKFIALARGLAPSYLRVGGTNCDYLIFSRHGHPIIGKRGAEGRTNFTLTAGDWDKLNHFVKDAGWDLIFDFNALLRKHGKWDSSNAVDLLKYSLEKGYKIAGYELGNELNYKSFGMTAQKLAPDYADMKKLLSSMHGLSPYIILGTDTGSLRDTAFDFMEDFFKAGGGKSLDVATFHQYYTGSQDATVGRYRSVSTLESLRPNLTRALDMCKKYIPGKPVWLGETSSSAGGGGAGDLSEKYVAGFLWLDKLGLAAELGAQGVMRQTFYGGDYGLVNHAMDPNPDYWITLLYKRLVGSPVLRVETPNRSLRFYAHCTNTKSSMGYHAGSVTLYMMNLSEKIINADFSGVDGKALHMYTLSPGDHNGLTSGLIKLNGNVLRLTHDNELPQIKPSITHGHFQIHPYHMVFIVIPDANKSLCH